MTYREALRYLDSFINYEQKEGYNYKDLFKLDRMRRLAAFLGDPQKTINSLHVAGSKGKGSTAAVIHSILKRAGFKAALYTSPHLSTFRERIRIGDGLIKEDEIARLAEKLKGSVEKLLPDRPTFFELYTAIAFLYFKEKKADLAIYETGLGGRLDATNIIEPLASVITPLSYEHTDKLGATLTEIAYEKCGIIKERTVCISAPQDPEAARKIEETCAERDSPLRMVGRDIFYRLVSSDDRRQIFDVSGEFGEYAGLETNLLGPHQAANCATAIAAVESLKRFGMSVPERALREGIRDVSWPGRFEIYGRNPYVILDGAQNRASARALAESIKQILKYKKLILVFGASKDKDIKGMLDELIPLADTIIATESNIKERALGASKLAAMIPAEKTTYVTSSVKEALSKAASCVEKDDAVIVTGSLFVVGEAREILCEKEVTAIR